MSPLNDNIFTLDVLKLAQTLAESLEAGVNGKGATS
jgi:hypothetical protein